MRRPQPPDESIPLIEKRWFFIAILAGISAARIFVLFFSEVDLGPDEAQYWFWSKDPAFGYFTKPPMIAWLIGVTTTLFGDAEWAVRLSSPVIGLATTLVIYLTADYLYGRRAAFYAGLAFTLMPIMILAGNIISTDIPLLLFWSVALYAFIRLIDGGGPGWSLLLGAALGLGMLSKYAMIYFPLGMALAAILSPVARRAVRPAPLLVSFLLAGAIFAPNVWWNAQNDFHTLAHTQANAGWRGIQFQVDELLEFLGAQFAVAGPLLFGFFIWALIRLQRRYDQAEAAWQKDLVLLAFSLPPLLIICFQALMAGANANWAMAAYPSLIILLTAWILRARRTSLLKYSIGLHAALGLVALIGVTNFALLDRLGLSESIKRVRGWEDQAADIAAYTKGFDTLIIDDRELMGNMLYYLRNEPIEIVAWDLNRTVEHHYEAFFKADPRRHDPALLLAKYPNYLFSYVEYDTIMPLGETTFASPAACDRTYSLFMLADYNPAATVADIPPPPADVDLRRNGDCRPY